MARSHITDDDILAHVNRLGEQHPPISLASVDRTVHNPDRVRTEFAPVIDYLARVELEVDRNVLELLTLLPDVSEVDRLFYQDVWQPQEIAHGLVLDQLQADLDMAPSVPYMEIQFKMKLLGALAHLPAIQEVSRFLYYLTGAATERQAVLAYNRLTKGLDAIDEPAISRTIISPIKVQEPGHFAFYTMSATQMVEQSVLAPWQMFLARVLRSASFELVGINSKPEWSAQMGAVMTALDLDADDELAKYAKDLGRLEARLLWANRNGMEFPPYFLTALRESVELYRERGFPMA